MSVTAASNVLNVTAVSNGQLAVGGVLSSNASGTDVANGTTITALGTGSGGVGTYSLSGNQQTVTSRTISQASSSSTTLTVTNITSTGFGGKLSVGDTLSSNSSGADVANGTTITALGTGSGGLGTYSVSGSAQTVSSRTITAASSIVRLAAATCNGSLALADTVNQAGGSTIYGNLGNPATTPGGGNGNSAGATYTLSAVTGSITLPTFVSTTQNTCGTNNINANMVGQSNSPQVVLDSGSAPAVGTAIQVYSGTGYFTPDNVSGTIGEGTLTVTMPIVNAGSFVVGKAYRITALNSTNFTLIGASSNSVGTVFVANGVGLGNGTASRILSVGDALFGPNILPKTTITALGTGTGGTGTYTVIPSQTAASGPIMARAAVLSVESSTAPAAFTMSRVPDTPLINAKLCGGVCPFLLGDGATTVGKFDLTGIIDYDDWSSGFACLSGVDASSILNAAQVVARRTRWREVVQ